MEETSQSRSPAAQDAATESAVLQHVLALQPAQVSLEELLAEVGGDPGSFASRDAVERAVRDLSASGLLQRSGELVLPTRAALRFDELLGG